MSNPEDRDPTPERRALSQLDAVVGRALERIEELRGRTRAAEARAGELEALLRRFTSGDEDPAGTVEQVQRLEEENDELRSRLAGGRETVERLLARIRFLEEKR